MEKIRTTVTPLIDKTYRLIRWGFFVEDPQDCDRGCFERPLSSGPQYGQQKTSVTALNSEDTIIDSTGVCSSLAGGNDGDIKSDISTNLSWKVLLWTLIVEFTFVWKPEVVSSDKIILAILGTLGILVIHRFRVSSICVRSLVLYMLTLVCAWCLICMTSHPLYLGYEYLGKKIILREYNLFCGTCPHQYVMATSLFLITCMFKGLHKHIYKLSSLYNQLSK